jgi:hypothetical protein
MIQSGGHGVRRLDEETVPGSFDPGKSPRKSRITHRSLQRNKLPVPLTGHPHEVGREAQRIGELTGDGKVA